MMVSLIMISKPNLKVFSSKICTYRAKFSFLRTQGLSSFHSVVYLFRNMELQIVSSKHVDLFEGKITKSTVIFKNRNSKNVAIKKIILKKISYVGTVFFIFISFYLRGSFHSELQLPFRHVCIPAGSDI